MWSLLRALSSRLGHGAWRSRKQVIWAGCLIAGLFLIYVEFVHLSSHSEGANGPQLLRSLNSFGQKEEFLEPNNVLQKVRFLDNDYVRQNEIPNDKPVKQQDAPLFREDTLQNSNSDAVRLLEQSLRERDQAKFPYDAQGYSQYVQVPQVGQFAINGDSSWTGGVVQYNIFGHPVYEHGNRPNFIPKERVIHIDLKGAPPLPSAFKTLIPWLAKYGATAVLIEYEDMFPWEGPLASLAAKNHYTKKDIKEILELCKYNNLEVIPLVQTFGHLEFALKGGTFAYLREIRDVPQALCPSKNESSLLVRAMINQIMTLHPKAKYLHIGCDEVYQMGECELCRQKIRDNIFLEHVSSVAKYVRSAFGVIPLIWHDMLTHVSSSAMKEFRFGELVEPVVWIYAEDIYRFLQPQQWAIFADVFPHIWAASAFKGAFGEQNTAPNVRRHLDNNLNWLDVMSAESSKFSGGFRGLVLTGWQRYDHFAVLCELLPAAIPSLAVNLIAVSHGFFNETLYARLYDALKCVQNQDYQNKLDLDSDPYLWNKFSWCFFPGALTFKLTSRLENGRKDFNAYIDRVTHQRGWLSDYNRRHNYSSPMRIEEDLDELPSHLLILKMLIKSAKDALSEWFDMWTTGEWIEQRMWPMIEQLENLQRESENMKSVKKWPSRPLPLLPELERYGVEAPKRTKRKLSHYHRSPNVHKGRSANYVL